MDSRFSQPGPGARPGSAVRGTQGKGRARLQRARAAARRVLRATGAAAILVCVAGIALRLGPRDRWPLLDVVYYATPLPVVLAVAVATAVALRRRPRRLAAAAVALACASCFVAGSVYRAAPSATRDRDLRVALWNVAHGSFGWDGLAEQLASFDADVICLVESKRLSQRDVELRRRLPGFDIAYRDGGLTILSRCGLRDVAELALPRGRALRATVGTERSIELVLVDLASDPWSARGAAIRALVERAPPLLLGDFNTPRSSVWFDALRRRHVHAFEAAGDGLVETWPWPLPLLDLDHVWCSAPLRVLACRYERSLCSDHSAVLVDLALP